MPICTSDYVSAVKPDPALYLLALEKLGVRADEAIAFEDSPNGILAAKRAGIFCVAIPNPLTKDLPLELADRRLRSLEEFDLDDEIGVRRTSSRLAEEDFSPSRETMRSRSTSSIRPARSGRTC